MKRSLCCIGLLGAFLAVSAVAEEKISFPEPDALLVFAKNADRERLVTRLYQAGAVYVGVVEIMEEPAGVRVYLPLDDEARVRVFRIANDILLGSGFGSEDDTGQDSLAVWFK